MPPRRADDPILILGILPRCGTNHLFDLLLAHPCCAGPREPIHEDLFLQHAHLLTRYTAAVRGAWDPQWGEFGPELPHQLHAAIGDGLLSFLVVDPSRRLVTKSPSVENLDLLFELFPRARAVVLVRDGRAVAESAMSTFGWPLDRTARLWARGAEAIRAFQERHGADDRRFTVVRYEDLVTDVEGSMHRLLDFLELDACRYDFDDASRLPVRGSSATAAVSGAVSWTPRPRDAGFSPLTRWHDWDDAQHRRFNWLAGKQMQYFGYEPQDVPEGRGGRAVQRLYDGRWLTTRFVERSRTAARRRIRGASWVGHR